MCREGGEGRKGQESGGERRTKVGCVWKVEREENERREEIREEDESRLCLEDGEGRKGERREEIREEDGSRLCEKRRKGKESGGEGR